MPHYRAELHVHTVLSACAGIEDVVEARSIPSNHLDLSPTDIPMPSNLLNNVNVAAEDLDDLEKAVNEESLPSTSGFFFGQSCVEDKEGDLEFIAAARKAIADGYLIYYTSWW